MAFDKFLSIFQFKDDDDDFDDDDDDDDITVKRSTRKPENTTSRQPRATSYSDRTERSDKFNQRPERSERMTSGQYTSKSSTNSDLSAETVRRERTTVRSERSVAPSKVVPIKSTTSRNGLEVSIAKPTSFNDSQDICDLLIGGKAVVANLEGFDPAEAQRIMDFISGCVYAMNGNLHQISNYIFIFSPDSIDISGDFLDAMSSEGFGVPKINREF